MDLKKERSCPDCGNCLKQIDNKMWFCPMCDDYYDEDLFRKEVKEAVLG